MQKAYKMRIAKTKSILIELRFHNAVLTSLMCVHLNL